MYTRANCLGVLVLLSAFAATGCGGDEPTVNAADLSCMAGTQSIPRTAADPCPQTTPQCPAPMYAAVSTCLPTGTWKDPCDCVLASTLGTTGAGGATAMNPSTASPCGNGMVEPAMGETCEPSLPVTTNCGLMNMGVGMVTCNPTTCTYDTSMCMMPSTMPVAGQGG